MTIPMIRFEPPSFAPMKNYDNIIPPSVVNLKRTATASTKDSYSYTTYETSRGDESSIKCGSSTYKYSSYIHDGQCDASTMTMSFDNNSVTTCHTGKTVKRSDGVHFLPALSETRTTEESLSSSQAILNEPKEDENQKDEEEDDQVIETNAKNRSLSLQWDIGNTMTLSSRIAKIESLDAGDKFELPDGVTKADISVTIDIDDEARSSRAAQLNAEDLDVEVLNNAEDGTNSVQKKAYQQRREFEDEVQQSILEDLTTVYTATPKSAKFVLCVVVSAFSDGTLEHTFWRGGRVGLIELALQWVLFDADDLQVYKRGKIVEKKDFGFGPLGLTESEGQHYLVKTLAPKAANDIVHKVGEGMRQDLLVEF